MISYASILLLVLSFQETFSLSINNVYSKFLQKETIDQSDTFGFHIPRPIGYKGDEPIWPRSYGYSAEMFIDENGAAFPVRPRKKIGEIIRPLGGGFRRYDDDDTDDVENLKKRLRRFYRKFATNK